MWLTMTYFTEWTYLGMFFFVCEMEDKYSSFINEANNEMWFLTLILSDSNYNTISVPYVRFKPSLHLQYGEKATEAPLS